MKNKLLSFVAIFSLAVSALLGLFLGGLNKLEAYANSETMLADYTNEDVVEARFLQTQNEEGYTAYLSNLAEPAGTTSGYGKFSLGKTDVSLTSTAREGFKLAGWQITYAEQENKTEYISLNEIELQNFAENGTVYDYYSKNLADKYNTQIGITLKFYDADSDGAYEKSEFIIDRVFEDLKVDAVYDFVYYNVEVTSVVNLTNIKNFSSISTDYGTIFYENLAENEYTNCYLLSSEKYYYFADLVSENGKFYSIHSKSDESTANEKIEISRGRFKLNDSVKLNFNINKTDDVYESVNIDLQGVTINDVPLTLKNESEQNNVYSFTQDEFLRTESVAVEFNITNKATNIKFVYHSLYVFKINYLFDDETADANELELALQNTTTENAYYEFKSGEKPTGQYLVKSSTDGVQPFRVIVNQKIGSNLENVLYVYYNFVSLDGYVNTSRSYSGISSNYNAEVKYSSQDYFVNFEFRAIVNGKITSLNSNFNLYPSQTLKRGESLTLTKQQVNEVVTNLGYTLAGFANYGAQDFNSNESITVKIDETAPKNLTVLLVYSINEYQVEITGINSKQLTDADSSFYAISALNYTINRNQYAQSLDERLNNLTLDNTISINNILTLNFALNEGFVLESYTFLGEEHSLTSGSLTITLNSDVISKIEGNKLTINLKENYKFYTFTYYINKTLDAISGTEIFMAEIDAQTDFNSSDVQPNIDKSTLEEDGRIVITNITLYTQIKLTAKSKTIERDEGNYSFAFNRFTETGLVGLQREYEAETDTYSHTTKILRDNVSIKVIYSMKDNYLNLLANNSAYEFMVDGESTVTISAEREDGTAPVLEEYEGGYRMVVRAGEKLTITLNQDHIKLGYLLKNCTFNGEDVDVTGLQVSVTMPASSSPTDLQFNFVELEYRIRVLQRGAGFTADANSYVKFNGQDYETITISNLTLAFYMPEGYYVSNAYILSDEEIEFNELNQTNQHTSAVFSYTFEAEELNRLFVTYAKLTENFNYLTFIVNYELHTFNVTVSYNLVNAKGNNFDSLINYPDLSLTYTLEDSVTVTPNRDNLSFTFENLPYGISANIKLLSNFEFGVSALGWFNEMGLPLNKDLLELNLAKLNEDVNLFYYLQYDEFNINVIYNAEFGNPTISKNRVTIFDNFVVYANANKAKGYMFSSFYYFVPYSYSEESWNDEIYIYDELTQNFVKNTADYTEGTNYYLKTTFSDFNSLEINEFLPTNYAIINNTFNVYIDYDLIKLTFNNIGELLDGQFAVNGVEHSIDEFITYEIYVLDNGFRPIQEGEKVDSHDVIQLRIILNSVNADLDPSTAYVYNLISGLNLRQISILGKFYNNLTRQDNVYISPNINLNELVVFAPDDYIVNIFYRYELLKNNITVTTNVTSESFYLNGDVRKFSMQYALDNQNNNFTSATGSELQIEDFFMHESYFLCGFTTNGGYSQYFFIDSIKVYSNNGRTYVSPADYQKYGISITINEAKTNITIRVRFVENIVIKVQVQPKINFNGAQITDGNYIFRRTFKYNADGSGIAQTLSVGSSSNSDISMADLLLNSLRLPSGDYNIIYEGDHTNHGLCEVSLKFNTVGEYSWLAEIELPYKIYLQIDRKEISIIPIIDGMDVPRKEYDGTTNYDVENLLKYLYFSDNSLVWTRPVNVLSEDLKISLSLNLSKLLARIESAQANEGSLYDIFIEGLALSETNLNNNNFDLTNSSVTLYDVITITRKELTLQGLKTFDRLFEENNLSADVDVINARLQGVIKEDDVTINLENLKFEFLTDSIGANKNLVLVSTDILLGADALNYKVKDNLLLTASIYPDKLSCEVEGYGTVTVFNELGKTDRGKVNLIPIGNENAQVKLVVDLILADTNKYTSIYPIISRFLNRSVFAVGYDLSFDVGGVKTKISNELFLSLPTVSRLTGAFYLTGEQSDRLVYSVQNRNLIINLSQINTDIKTFYLTEQRVLLTWWQILLIVILAVTIISLIVLLIIIIRRKKLNRYNLNERI